jgi:DNA topoisomerase-1
MASSALGEAKKVIKEKYGEKYLKTRQWKTDEKGAEEAHEAIRPTSFKRDPESIKKYLKDDEFKLYQLIYQRALASQMSAAVFDKTKLIVGSLPDTEYEFKALGQIIKFDGFLDMYPVKTKQERLPDLKEDDKTDLLEVNPEQHFTRPPGRFSEASLIKELKEDGIGRPSTYAAIMKTIKDRNYVRKERKSLVPTKVGRTVNKLLVDHFPQIVDIDFTANMEENLDEVAKGKRDWQDVISEFYQPFAERLDQKMDEISKKDIIEEEIDEECPECGAPLVKKLSKNGEFISCSRFPDCKYARSIEKKTGIDCPECEKGEIVEKKTKKGKTFYGCSSYPDCEFALWQEPTGEKCPKCGSLLVKSNSGKTIYCPEKECDFKKSVND